MATIIKTNGERISVQPKNRKDFKLGELRKVVDGYIEIVYLSDGKLMVVNEEGMPLQLPYNPVASLLAGQPIVGDVLVCESNQIK